MKQPMRVADRLFLCTNNPFAGTPRADPGLVSLVLAAGLIGELFLTRHVASHNGRIYPSAGPPPADALCHSILERVQVDTRPSMRSWLRYLATTSYEMVAERCEAIGMVIAVEQRGRLIRRRPSWRYPARDPEAAEWARIGLANHLRSGELSWDEALAGVLLHATALDGRCLGDVTGVDWPVIARSLGPPFVELIAHARAVCEAAVLTP